MQPHRIVETERAKHAVELTKQLPTWAQLGWALMLDFKVEEAVHTLEDALSYRGESAPAAQETHNYLGFLYSFRRDWASASTHFVKAVDLGLPSNATGCRAGRWADSSTVSTVASLRRPRRLAFHSSRMLPSKSPATCTRQL